MVLVIVILAVNVALHRPVLDALLFTLALAVGLTPQLLPAIVRVTLSQGAHHMDGRCVADRDVPAAVAEADPAHQRAERPAGAGDRHRPTRRRAGGARHRRWDTRAIGRFMLAFGLAALMLGLVALYVACAEATRRVTFRWVGL